MIWPKAKRPRGPDIDLNRISIATKPGEEFHYHGIAMHVLQRAVEAATGKDFYDSMREKILDPLGLDDTFYLYERDLERPLIPVITGESSAPDSFYATTKKGNRFGNGLYSSARDLNRYSQLWLSEGSFKGQSFFSPELKQEAWKFHGMRESDKGRYGILWWLFEEEGGYVISGAFLSISAVVPSTNVVVTVMFNRIVPSNVSFNFKAEKMAMVEYGKKL